MRSPKKWQATKPSPHLLSIDHGHEPDRHQGAAPRRVRLDNEPVADSSAFQLARERVEGCFVRHSQDDRVGAFRKAARATLASRVNQARCLYASGQVCPHDDVVKEGGGLGRFLGARAVAWALE